MFTMVDFWASSHAVTLWGMKRAICVTVAALALAATGFSWQGTGRGRGNGRGQEHAASHAAGPMDHAVVADYFRGNPGGLPPGLAKRGDLPPGLAKQLRRNGTLPPGLAKKVAPFPPALEAELAPCPAGVRRGIVGGVAIMYNSRTGLIVDAFALAGF